MSIIFSVIVMVDCLPEGSGTLKDTSGESFNAALKPLLIHDLTPAMNAF